MEFSVNNQPVPIEALTFREMGYGQWTFGKAIIPCRIAMTRTEALDSFAQGYDEYISDLKEDERFRRRGEDADYDQLVALAYPPLPKLLEYAPRLVEYLLGGPMALGHVLPALFPGKRPGCRFSINAIDRAEVSEIEIVLHCSVFAI